MLNVRFGSLIWHKSVGTQKFLFEIAAWLGTPISLDDATNKRSIWPFYENLGGS